MNILMNNILGDIYTFTIYIIILYFSNTYNILIDSVTIDSLLSAIQFTKDMLSKSKNHTFNTFVYPFIENIRIDTTVDIISRYTYYVILQMTFWVLKIFIWHDYINYTYYLWMLLTLPSIMVYVRNFKYINSVTTSIEKKMNKIAKKIMLQIYCKFINNILSGILDSDPKINPNEIEIFNRKKPHIDISNFLKIFAISMLIEYLESIQSSYLRLVKMLYNYGVIVDLKHDSNIDKHKYDNINDPKKKIQKIVENRDWDHMFTQYNLTNIIHMYKTNNKVSLYDTINKYVYVMEIYLGKLFAFYSITILFGNPYVATILSIYIMYILSEKYNAYLISFKIIGIMMWYMEYNLWYVSMISELSEILDNHIVIFITMKICGTIYDYINKIAFINEHIYDIILSCISAFVLTYVSCGRDIYMILITILISISNRNPYISSIIMLCGYTSNYSIKQLAYMACIIMLILNIYQIETNKKLNIISSFIKKTTSMDQFDNSIIVKKNKNIMIDSNYMNIDNINSVVVTKKSDVMVDSKYMDYDRCMDNSIIVDSNDDISQNDKMDDYTRDQDFLNSGIIIPKNSNLLTMYNNKMVN